MYFASKKYQYLSKPSTLALTLKPYQSKA